LKITFADGFRTYLSERPTEYDPLKLLGSVKKDVQTMAVKFMRVFGSAGRA
jgi:fructose/tagatose bisphosphate aldolase